MKNDAARKLKQIPAGYLLMGVDPHKKKHAAVAMTQDAIVHTRFKFTNSKAGFEEMLERARAEMVRASSRGIIFAIETASHYWRNLAYCCGFGAGAEGSVLSASGERVWGLLITNP